MMNQLSGKRHLVLPPTFEVDAEEPEQGANLRTVKRIAKAAATAAASGKADAEAVQRALADILAHIAGIGTVTPDDPRLTDAREPTLHAPSHGPDGADPLALPMSAIIDLLQALADKADTTTLNNYATKDFVREQGYITDSDLDLELSSCATKTELRDGLATKAPLTSGIIDTTLTKSDASFVVDIAPFPNPLPQFVTIRAKAPADYDAGDTLTINTTRIPISTPGGVALPNDAWVSGNIVEVTIDTMEGRAFFKCGVGGAGSGEVVAWNIFPGMTPAVGYAPGLYVPDATAPTLTLVHCT